MILGMKFIAERSAILPSLALAARAAEEKSTMFGVRQVQLRATESSLSVAATNLQDSVSSSVPSVVLEPGSCGVNAKGLLERVRLLPETAITFSLDDGKLTLTVPGTSRRYSVKAVGLEELPCIEEPGKKFDASYPASLYVARVAAVRAAMSDASRPNLASALFLTSADDLAIVATDGHRLHRVGTPNPAAQREVLVPSGGVALLASFLDGVDGDVTVSMRADRTCVYFSDGASCVAVKRPGDDVRFPPYEHVIPDPGRSELDAVVSRGAVLDAIKAMSVVQDFARVTASAGKIVFEARDDEGETATESVAAVTTNGADRSMYLQLSYVRDAVSAAAGDDICLSFFGFHEPLMVRCDEDFLAVVMPRGE